MPFGSLCNLLGQIYAGKQLSSSQMEALIDLAWKKAKEMVDEKYEEALNKEQGQAELPI